MNSTEQLAAQCSHVITGAKLHMNTCELLAYLAGTTVREIEIFTHTNTHECSDIA